MSRKGLAPGEPHVLVVKVGGGLLSDKRTGGGTSSSAIDDFAALLDDLVTAYPGRVVLVTGGGSLCHTVGVGVNEKGDPFSAVALTEPAFAMKWAWTAALRARGVRAVPLQVAAMAWEDTAGEVVANTAVVRRVLAEGALPVLSSDFIVTAAGTLRILSSDYVPGILVHEQFAPVRIVTLADVPGILTGTELDSPVLPHVDLDDLAQAESLIWPTGEWDATGAMAGKVAALAEHARRGAECLITRGDQRAPSLRYLFDPLSCWPSSIPRTVIARRQSAPLAPID
jgi:isopentenyl phosphate kinase